MSAVLQDLVLLIRTTLRIRTARDCISSIGEGDVMGIYKIKIGRICYNDRSKKYNLAVLISMYNPEQLSPRFSQPSPMEVKTAGEAATISARNEQTGQFIVGVGVTHIPGVTLECPDMQLVKMACESVMGTGESVLAINEGRTPRVVYQGEHFPGQTDTEFDAAHLDKAVPVYGEKAILVGSARIYGHDVVGEDDPGIIAALERDGGFSRDDIVRHLIGRQATNFPLIAQSERPSLEEYMRVNVVDRYERELAGLWGGFGLSVDEVVTFVHDKLAEVGTSSLDEGEALGYLLGQYTIGPVTTYFLETGELNRDQQVTLAHNWFRDGQLKNQILEGWGMQETPHKIAVVGSRHLDAVVEELEGQSLISSEDCARYVDAARRIGRRVLRWSTVDLGRVLNTRATRAAPVAPFRCKYNSQCIAATTIV
jgi:hypothetical protein